jgi:tetratricopeptide (TPR) repeat protein
MNTDRLNRLLQMHDDDPKDPFLLYAIAMEYNNGNKHLKALEYYERLTNEHENYVGTYYHLAKLYEKLNKVEDAETCYKKGMEIARKIGDSHAFNELQSAFASFNGIEPDDEY